MSMQFHDGQILRISDLSVDAKVLDHGSGRDSEDNGDCLRIREINPVKPTKLPDRGGAYASSYNYHRKDGEGWTDCTGEPVTIVLIKDAPQPYRVGAEAFFGEMMVALCEGFGNAYPPMASEFCEAVRNHVATEGCGDQWKELTLARLRGGHAHLPEPKSFIKEITVLDAACLKPYQKREAFRVERRGE